MLLEKAQRLLWDVYSRCYDGLLDFIPYQRLVARVVERAELEPGHRLVDLGCGTGNALDALDRAVPGAQLMGIDASSSMLSVARRKLAGRPSVQVREGDVLEWLRTAETDSVDRIVTVNVLYTMQADAREVFWREAVRVLAPNGRMVVVTTDRAGIGPVVREHTAERSFLSSITPRLAAVIVMNLLIWLLESRKVFDPASVETLQDECARAGGAVLSVERCYGGEIDGVDVLLVAEPVVDLTATPAAETAAPTEVDLRDAPVAEVEADADTSKGLGARPS